MEKVSKIWGTCHQGKHQAIIPEELFEEVQIKLRRPLKRPLFVKHLHVFKGMIRCADCGSLITWDTKKGHHYGYCKSSKPECGQEKYVRQEVIEEQIFEMFKKITPKSERVVNWIKDILREAHAGKTSYTESKLENLNKSFKLMENRLEKLYEDKLDGVVSIEFYNKKFKEYAAEKEKILKELNRTNNNSNQYYEAGIAIHELAFRSHKIYQSKKATVEDKRLLLSYAFENMRLSSDHKLTADYTLAFRFLSQFSDTLNAISEPFNFNQLYARKGTCVEVRPTMLPKKNFS